MKNNKGFTLIELMIVISIIAIIAAIAIPNLMQSRIRANEGVAVTCVKGYATAQVTFQVGRQGRIDTNTGAGKSGYADNFRNLYYGYPVGSKGDTLLELISQSHADAATDVNDNSDTDTVGGGNTLTHYQGYRFMSPKGVTVDGGDSWFSSQFGQIAVPVNSSSTGTNAYYVGLQGQVWMLGLPENLGLDDIVDAVGDKSKNPSGDGSDWTTL